jgi:hypothetical protein
VIALVLKRSLVAVLAFAVVASPAEAASKHRKHKPKTRHAAVKRVTPAAVPAPAPASEPAPTPAPPATTSVISIGGYVFYNLTYAEAVAAYQAAVAAAPAGYTPPPVTSVSVTTTVGT